MSELRFFFDCYALCTIEREDGYKPRASLCEGFFADADAALLASKGVETRRAVEMDRQTDLARKQGWYVSPARQTLTPQEYQIVPLKAVRFDSLYALEDAICTAAVLQAAGVGAETGRA